MVVHLTDEDFGKMIEEHNVAVIDFWATWCMPCKMMAPTLEQLAVNVDGVLVGKVDVDECPRLASAYNVQSIPDIVIFKDGEVFDTLVGVRPYAEMEAAVQKALA